MCQMMGTGDACIMTFFLVSPVFLTRKYRAHQIAKRDEVKISSLTPAAHISAGVSCLASSFSSFGGLFPLKATRLIHSYERHNSGNLTHKIGPGVLTHPEVIIVTEWRGRNRDDQPSLARKRLLYVWFVTHKNTDLKYT